jgi:hypothetical protein
MIDLYESYSDEPTHSNILKQKIAPNTVDTNKSRIQYNNRKAQCMQIQ